MSTTESTRPYDTSFRLLDFNIFDEKRSEDENSDGDEECEESRHEEKKYKKNENFTTIQMFGLNEKGETCAIFVRDYQPLDNSTEICIYNTPKRESWKIL
jgi:hypothetical protein